MIHIPQFLCFPASFRLPCCYLPFYFLKSFNSDDKYLGCLGILNQCNNTVVYVMLFNS
nr:MAG TPA: hypothetical protein [Caudoviricetes sp.]